MLTGIWPALLLLSVAAKWILIGRYRPGAYPLRSWYYLRFWLARRFQLISGSTFLAGTPFMSLYLRAMGAKVGRGCTISTPFFGVFDLLRIGDDTSIGVETQILGYRVEDGMLHIGSVDIGSRCFIGTHAAVGPRRLDERRRAARRSVVAARRHAHPRGRGAARLAGATGRGAPADAGDGRATARRCAAGWAMLGALQLLALRR